MTTKRATLMLAVPVVIVLNGCGGLKHQGRTVSEVTPSERPKAAPTAAVIGPGIPRERLYKVEAVGFHAVDESGPDWWDSDEIYAEWRDPKSDLVSETTTYEGIDTGDTVVLDPHQACILLVNGVPSTTSGPRACSGGVTGPFDFEVALFEDDTVTVWNNFCPRHPGFIGPSCSDDDLIDKKMVSFTTAELEAAMPHVGDIFQESIPIRNFCGVPESRAGNTV
jgi:hypothetical protein